MKKMFLFTFLTLVNIILMTSTLSALEFDDVKKYIEFEKDTPILIGDKFIDYKEIWEEYKPIKIDNWLGLGETLFSGALNEHTSVCFENCFSTIDIHLENDGVLIQDIMFKTLKENGDWIEQGIRNYTIKIKTGEINKNIIDYEYNCVEGKINPNGSVEDVCSEVAVGSHIEVQEVWDRTYNIGEEVIAGDYKIKIEGKKKPERTVDWIIKTQGKWIEEWAGWGGSSLVDELRGYWKMDETEGVFVLDSLGLNNGTATNMNWSVNGLIEGAGNSTSQGNAALNLGYAPLTTDKAITFNFWQKSSLESHQTICFKGAYTCGVPTTDGDFRVYTTGSGGWQSDWHDGTARRQADTPTTQTSGNWHMITFIINQSTVTGYIDAVNGTPTAATTFTWNANTIFYPWNLDGLFTINSFIDEIGIWNRSLTQAELNILYNTGNGQTYPDFGSSSITLDAPEDNYYTSSPLIQFNISSNISGATLTNISLWHNASGIWEKNQTNIVTGNSNLTSFTANFTDGTFIWNGEVCNSDGDCSFASSNRTFIVDSISPTILINSGNGTLSYGSLNENKIVNYTIIDINLDAIWISYNGTNTTLEGESGILNTTNFQLEYNLYNATIYANDSIGNLASQFFSWAYVFFEGQTNYNSSAFETASELFTINVTSSENVFSSTGILVYNGTEYNGNSICEGGECGFSKNLTIPLINGHTPENKSFYWKLTLYNGTTSFNLQTSPLTQEVSRIYLAFCNSTIPSKALNFTVFSEDNLTKINDFSFSSTLQNWIGEGSVRRNNSFENTSSSEINLCTLPGNVTQKIEGQVDYSSDPENISYVPRNYFFEDYGINSTLQHIPLYLLPSEDSTSFILKVQDKKLTAISDALIHIQKYFPSDGTYKTVQISKTDNSGKTIGFFKTETVEYRFIIIKNGTTLLLTEKQKVFPEETPYTLTFTISDILTYPWTPFEKNASITSSLEYDSATSVITYSYIDSTVSVLNGRLLVIQESFSNSSFVVICNKTSNDSSATLTCDTSSYEGEAIAYGYVNEDLTDLLNFTITTARDIFGNTGLIISFFIILVAGFAFIWNPTAGIISLNFAIIFTNLIGFLSLSPIFIFSMIFVSIVAIILLKT